MLQAALEVPTSTAAESEAVKVAVPDPVTPGDPLTYTIQVRNNSSLDLHATVTDN